MSFSDNLPLKSVTSLKWVEAVKKNFSFFLQDHAACERKASATAMSFIIKFPDRTALIEPMIALAKEELEHFQDVYRKMTKKQIPLAEKDVKDVYVNSILKQLRHGRDERFLDKLITFALVEARGYERFNLISKHLDDKEWSKFYYDLGQKERGHYMIFIRLARQYFKEEDISEALERIAKLEAEALARAPLNGQLH